MRRREDSNYRLFKTTLLVYFIFLVIFLNFNSLSKTTQSALNKHSASNLVQRILINYQKKKSVVMDVQKTFRQELLQKTTHSKGRFYFSNKRWKLDIFSPKKLSIIYDGTSIFYTDLESNNSHLIPSDQLSVLPLLFDQRAFNQTFQYQERKQKGRTVIYVFKGLKPPAPSMISIQIERNYILSLDIDWQGSMSFERYQFSSIQFDQTLSSHLFSHSQNSKKKP